MVRTRLGLEQANARLASVLANLSAGVTMHAKPGDEVRAGQPLLTLHTATPERFTRAREALAGGIVISQAGSSQAADAAARRERGVVLERIG